MKKLLLAGSALAALASTAQAADLGVARPVEVPAAIVAPPPFTWTGFYVGAHLGWGSSRSTYRDATGVYQETASTGNGLFGGAQVGYNWQINQFVLGLEGDVAGAGINKRTEFNNGDAFRTSVPFLASVRLRAGYAFDRALIYATGGLGIGTFSQKYYDFSANTTLSSSSTRLGYAVGGGIEYAFMPNWSAKVEYLYYGFGDRTPGFTERDRTAQNIHTIKLGVNYLFNTGPGPATARY